MEAIWDSLIHYNSEIESPEWHGDILSARKLAIEEGKAEFISIEEFALVPNLQIGNLEGEALASRDGKLELPRPHSQARAWE